MGLVALGVCCRAQVGRWCAGFGAQVGAPGVGGAPSRAPGGAAPGAGPGGARPSFPAAAPEAGDGTERAVSEVPARGVGGVAAPGWARGAGPRVRDSGPRQDRPRTGVWAPVGAGQGGGVAGAPRGPGLPEVEPGLRREAGREDGAAPASGPAEAAAAPAPAAPRGPGPWPAVPRGRSPGEEASPVATPPARPHEDRAEARPWAGTPARPPCARRSAAGGAAAGVPAAATCDRVTRNPSRRRQLALSSSLACPRASQPVSGPSGPATLGMPHPGPRPLAGSYSPAEVVGPEASWDLASPSFPSLPACCSPRSEVVCPAWVLTRTQGHRQPLSHPHPETPPLGSQWTLTCHRPCQPWTPTSLDHEPRGLGWSPVGSVASCAHQTQGLRRSSWSGWVGAAGGGCPYILDVFAPLWGGLRVRRWAVSV